MSWLFLVSLPSSNDAAVFTGTLVLAVQSGIVLFAEALFVSVQCLDYHCLEGYDVGCGTDPQSSQLQYRSN